jgi:hypothetical protein
MVAVKGGSAVDSINPWGVPKVTPLGDGGIELDGPHTPEQLDVARVLGRRDRIIPAGNADTQHPLQLLDQLQAKCPAGWATTLRAPQTPPPVGAIEVGTVTVVGKGDLLDLGRVLGVKPAQRFLVYAYPMTE